MSSYYSRTAVHTASRTQSTTPSSLGPHSQHSLCSILSTTIIPIFVTIVAAVLGTIDAIVLASSIVIVWTLYNHRRLGSWVGTLPSTEVLDSVCCMGEIHPDTNSIARSAGTCVRVSGGERLRYWEAGTYPLRNACAHGITNCVRCEFWNRTPSYSRA